MADEPMIQVALTRQELEHLLIATVNPFKMFGNNEMLNKALENKFFDYETATMNPVAFENLDLIEMWNLYISAQYGQDEPPKIENKPVMH